MSNVVMYGRVSWDLALMAAVILTAAIANRAAADELQQPENVLAVAEGEKVFETLSITSQSEEDLDVDIKTVSACGGRCGKCDRCARKRVWIAGAEATFLVPDFHAAALTSTVAYIGDYDAETISSVSTSAADMDDMYIGPRVWLGVQGERWGVVGRYWELSDSQVSGDTLATGGFLTAHRFDIYTADVELTRRFCRRNSEMMFSVGARHASASFGSLLSTVQPVGYGDLLATAAVASHRFDGTGFTVGFQGRRPVCSARRTNLHLFWNVRGSLLWGDFSNRALSATAFSGGRPDTYFDVDGREDDLFIGEVQLGFQCEHKLRCLPASTFIRVAAEYQNWDGDGGAASAPTWANSDDTAALTTASSNDLRMNLVGFTLGAGLNW